MKVLLKLQTGTCTTQYRFRKLHPQAKLRRKFGTIWVEEEEEEEEEKEEEEEEEEEDRLHHKVEEKLSTGISRKIWT